MLIPLVTILVPVALLLAVAGSLRAQSRQRWIDRVVADLEAEEIERVADVAFVGEGLRPRRVALVLTRRALVLVDEPIQRIPREQLRDHVARAVDGRVVVSRTSGHV
jgi:hypothetical protein